MTWLLIAAAVAAGIDWRHLLVLLAAVLAPLPAASLVAIHWWRARPSLSTRAVRFCEAISGELRSGASLRASVERAAISVEAHALAASCSAGAPMDQIARMARLEFQDVGPELEALLTRAGGLGVSPAALFEEIAGLALAQVEVAQEVALASAPARATGAVLLLAPLVATGWALTRGGFDAYLRQPAQRGAILIGLALVGAGVLASVTILRRAR